MALPEQMLAPSSEINSHLRDIEDKQSLLTDRVLLIGQTLVEGRDKTFEELQDLKKKLMILEEENKRIRGFIQRMTEQMDGLARKDELAILQRQFDIFRQ